MIPEFFLIVELLKNSRSESTPSTVQPIRAVKHTKGSGATLGGSNLFRLGKIEKITQPVKGVYITPRQAADAYLKAGTGRPEKIGTGGRF